MLRVADGPTSNLVESLTSFLGRARDLEALDAMPDSTRLLSLLGPGGIGKTRLAIAFARHVLDSGQVDQAWFCDLCEARTTGEICRTIATTLGFGLVGDDPIASVTTALRARGSTLLILDNCEQAIEAAAEVVVRVVESAPAVRCLVTSRERLRVAGEVVHPLEPLTVDASVALFTERARDVRRDFAVSAADHAIVEQIVTKLDNIPLAIELAAAQTVVLGVESLLTRLEDRFGTLEPGVRAAGTRHATLRAAIDWSWDLLAADERSALAQATVFEGPFALGSAERVIEVAGPRSILALLGALRDRSLLRTAVVQGAEDPRFCIYESIRAYAREQLTPAVQAEVRRRHAEHFLGEFEALDAFDADEASRLRWLDQVHAELRSIAHTALDDEQLDLALRALIPVAILVGVSGPVAPTLTLIERAIDRSEEQPPAVVVRVLQARALLLLRCGRLTEALDQYRDVTSHLDALGDTRWQTEAHLDLATALRRTGSLQEAEQVYVHALGLAQRQGDTQGEARALGDLGGLLFELGQAEESRVHHERALALYQGLENRLREGVITQNLGLIHQELGDRARAGAYFGQALAIHRASGHRRFEGIAYLDLAVLGLEQDAPIKARELARSAFEILESVGDRRQCALAQVMLATAEASLGEVSLASLLLDDAERELAAIGDPALTKIASVHRGHIDLALAVKARVRGDLEDVKSHRARAAKRTSGMADQMVDELRVAERLLVQRRAQHVGLEDALIVSVRASWLCRPDGTHHDLSRHRAQMLILAALLEGRLRDPGTSLPVESLVRAGWGDERIRSDAASNRLQVTMSKLRKIGLGAALLHQDSGYLIDPLAPLFVTT